MLAETMDNCIREMALRCCGYGRWSAPYWFIGPEQGQAPEENDDLKPRVKAWQELGCGELTDCRDFHALGEALAPGTTQAPVNVETIAPIADDLSRQEH